MKKNRISIPELVEEIIYQTGYYAFLNNLPNRKESSTNLIVFLDFLRYIQDIEMFRLTDFLFYIQDYDVFLSKPQIVGEKSNVVKLMTIHSAKGLESRAVIYIATSGNTAGYRRKILMDKNLLGIKLIDKDKNYVYLNNNYCIKEIEEEKRLSYVALTRAKELFYYIGVDNLAERNEQGSKLDSCERDGKDGWKSFINLKKDFVKNNLLQNEENKISSELKKAQLNEVEQKVISRIDYLENNQNRLTYLTMPKFITITQLLDIEFMEAAFKNRYLYRSFPVDESLKEIASAEDLLMDIGNRAEIGTYFHKVFRFAGFDNYEDYIEKSIIMESESIIEKKEQIILTVKSYFNSDFYNEHFKDNYTYYSEWEINYPFYCSNNNFHIKGALDKYIRKGKESGAVVDYKLKLNKDLTRYQRQLNYYAYFLNNIGYPVTELYLYDIEENKAVKVDIINERLKEKIEENISKIINQFSILK